MREKLLWCAIYISAMQQERRDVMAIMCKRSGVCRSPAKVCHQVKIRSGDVFSPIPCKLANRDPMIHESF